MLIDGLSYRWFAESEAMQQVVGDERFSVDGRAWRMRVQQPSISLPNWLSYLTSAPPEFTGQWGNVGASTPVVDTFWRQAALADVSRAVEGSASWHTFLWSYITPLVGDGTYEYSHIKETEAPDPPADARHESMWNRDKHGRDVLYQALESDNPQFDLIVGYLANVDAQGHRHGAASPEYAAAMNFSASVLRGVLDRLDANTTLFVVADHGHSTVGGHGGQADSVWHVPLLVYRRGSGLAASRFPYAQFPTTEEDPITSLDVAPSLCAVMGLPTPRASFGNFLPEVLALAEPSTLTAAYEDLYIQRYRLARAYALDLGMEAHVAAAAGDEAYLQPPSVAGGGGVTMTTELPTPAPARRGADEQDIEFYRDQVVELDAQILAAHNALWASRAHVNAALGVALSVLVLVAWGLALRSWAFTGAPFSAVSRCCGAPARVTRLHRIAAVIALLSTTLAFATALGFFRLIYSINGRGSGDDWRWDYTMFNSASDAYYLVAVNLSGGLLGGLLAWGFESVFVRCDTCRGGDSAPLAYAVRMYSATYTIVALLVLFDMKAPWCLWVSNWLPTHFVDADMWALQFRVFGVSTQAAAVSAVQVCLLWRLARALRWDDDDDDGGHGGGGESAAARDAVKETSGGTAGDGDGADDGTAEGATGGRGAAARPRKLEAGGWRSQRGRPAALTDIERADAESAEGRDSDAASSMRDAASGVLFDRLEALFGPVRASFFPEDILCRVLRVFVPCAWCGGCRGSAARGSLRPPRRARGDGGFELMDAGARGAVGDDEDDP